MNRLLLYTFAAGLFAQTVPPAAEQAHTKGDLTREREILVAAAAAGSADDRVSAELRLAWLDWRFYMADAEAISHFRSAEALKAGLTTTYTARARFETARGRYGDARAYARRALSAATNRREEQDASYAFAYATIEEAFETGKTAAARAALDLITEVVRAEPGRFEPSRVMYGLALLTGQAARADEALRSYHWGGSTAPLYPEAALAGKPENVVAYSRFCRRVQRIADEHYRRIAIGEVKLPHTVLREPILAEARKFWPAVETGHALGEYLKRHFNAYLGFENFGLTFGHHVLDEDVSFEQYGHKASVGFIVLDSMVSNGYVTWLSDGRAIIGGWAGPPIVQVRRDDALLAWMAMNDPERRDKLNVRIASAAALDDDVARKRPVGYMAALSLRMYRRSGREILESLRAKGVPEAEVRLHFMLEFQRRHRGCVQAHEARHIIDREVMKEGNRELTAALSQVLFGPDPVTCQAGILGPNIGRRDNGTSEANMLMLDAVAHWMDAHAEQIKALDRTRPALSQFDLLTHEQIRAAFRSMDPLAGGVLPKRAE
ncbi:MAG TPA: hypothetical protein VN428_23635 [Bryobacteraceae bacterium]|nr:hypothetical protein [Bryobacteraceae bacterium]